MTNRIIVLFFVLLGAVAMLPAQTVTVTLTTDEGYERPAAISKAEENLSRVLTEINAAQRENRNLNVVGLPMTDFAVKSLTMIWATVHFYCDDEEVVDRCWPFKDFMEVDHIPLIITPQGEEFGSGTYQEAVVEFDKNGRISVSRSTTSCARALPTAAPWLRRSAGWRSCNTWSVSARPITRRTSISCSRCSATTH